MKNFVAILAFVAVTSHGQPVGQHKLSEANNLFGINLLKALDSTPTKNIFFSPFSVSTAMGMLYSGSAGETKEELSQGLGYAAVDLSDADLLALYQQRREALVPSTNTTVFNVANSAVIQQGFKPLESYLRDLDTAFDAELRQVDFVRNGDAAVQEVNDWVSQKTQGKIPKLLEEKPDGLTRMILLNAIYFKGIWKTKFAENKTKPSPFYNGGSQEVQVPTMTVTARLAHIADEDLNADIVDLPYEGGEFSLTVLLPKERSGIESLKVALTTEKLVDVQNRLFHKTVNLALPRFKLEGAYKLKDTLESLGLKRVFDKGEADLSGINGGKDLYVSAVLHKAVVEVNEEGSKVAGATGVLVATRVGSSGSRYVTNVKVDHPFIFLIRDTKGGNVLFLGQVNAL